MGRETNTSENIAKPRERFAKSFRIRSKTLLIIAVTLVGLLFVMYIPMNSILLRSFTGLEEQSVRTNVGQAHNALWADVGKIDNINADWAGWDDMYDFVVSHDPRYITSDLNTSTILGVRINILVILAGVLP